MLASSFCDGHDSQLIYTFNAPIEWADSDRAFLISYKDDSSFPVAVVPEAGTQLAGGKHTARLRLSNADFNNFNDGVTCNDVPEVDVAPTAAPPPPAPTVVPAPQCVANQQGNFDVETPFLLNGEWTHDCALQQTTFHFLADRSASLASNSERDAHIRLQSNRLGRARLQTHAARCRQDEWRRVLYV